MNTKTYTTTSGDMWDGIAKKVLGDERHKTALVKANIQHAATYIFGGDIVLKIPKVETAVFVRTAPWKVGSL